MPTRIVTGLYPIGASGGAGVLAEDTQPTSTRLVGMSVMEVLGTTLELSADLADDTGIAAALTVLVTHDLSADIADDLGIDASLSHAAPGEFDLTADIADDLGITATIHILAAGELAASLRDEDGIDAALTISIKPQAVQCIVIAV